MRLLPLVALALSASTLAISVPVVAQASAAKKPVRGIDDLPRYSYPLTGRVETLLTDDRAMRALAAAVKRDVSATLAGYDIRDRAMLRNLHRTLREAALVEGDWGALKRETEIVRSLQDKEADKLISGNVQLAILDANATNAAPGSEAWHGAFRKAYAARIDPLPWAVVGAQLSESVNTIDGWTAPLVIGATTSDIQPSIDKGGRVSAEEAARLVGVYASLRHQLPLKADFAAVEGAYVRANKVAKPDIWAARSVTLKPGEAGLRPVVVAVWDSGVDITPFSGVLWTNPGEKTNGRDDDGNGYVDDVHGIAFDDHGRRQASLLTPPPAHIDAARLDFLRDMRKGYGDQQAGIDSPEARAGVAWLEKAGTADTAAFMRDSNFWRGYAHGTHVAGIVADGDPYVRILSARYSFADGSPPRRPTREIATALAKVHEDTVAYMKKAGVRVVNMSWTVDIKTEYEDQLVANGVPSEEAAAQARALFAIEAAGLRRAMESAPEILFVCAAGNANDNAAFTGSVPAGWDMPNLLTVAAVDQAGDPTSFTTTGPTIDIAANGYQVDSFIPGGKRALFSGTSMASPNVVNAAAKVVAANPRLTMAQLRSILIDTATPGAGGLRLLNPRAAVDAARARSIAAR